ncbi:hypothetical protein QOT17_007070 [Balamuthia mandrillaris]
MNPQSLALKVPFLTINWFFFYFLHSRFPSCSRFFLIPPQVYYCQDLCQQFGKQELVALMTTTNSTPSPPALAPTPVDSKAIHGKIKHLRFPTFDGQNIIQNYGGAKLRLESHLHSWVMLKNGSCPKLRDSLHSWASFKMALQQTFSLADSTAARATMLKKLMQGNMGVRPFYDHWTTVYDEIYSDTNEEVKFDTFCEKLSEHNQLNLQGAIWL